MDGKVTDDARTWADEELIRRYLETENRQLFAILVQRHQNQVYSMCTRILGSPTLAEEVAQDVFVAVYKNLARFRGDAKFTTWMYRVVVNHCKNKQAYRFRRKEKQHESLDQPKELEGGTVKRELPSSKPGPERIALANERQRILHAGLAQLSEEQRSIIVMRDLHGLPYDEIAESLGVAQGTVKSRLHRARNELKNRVGRLLVTLEGAQGAG